MVFAMSTTASIEISYPADNQLASPPLSGKFFVECHNVDGNAYATSDMDLTISASGLKAVLETDCSFLKGKISVSKLTSTWSKTSLGTEFMVDFFGVS